MVKSIETATLFSFVIIPNIMVKTVFQEQLFNLIAKVERKQTLYLKHEIILHQKEKRSRIFQVKTSKNVRKMIVPLFMFLFNSFEVCHSFCKENKNILQFSLLNQ